MSKEKNRRIIALCLEERGKETIFNIGFWELILVLLIAFLVVGPKDLPKVARWLGRMVKKVKQLIRDVKKETGWDELEKEVKDTRKDMNQTLADLKKDVDVRPAFQEVSSELDTSVKDIKTELHGARESAEGKS